MARITVDPGFTLQCDVDDYLWPWDTSMPVVMLHGFARNAGFWRRWVPFVAENHRVYRPELRGFGRSDVPPESFVFTLDTIMGDLVRVLDQSGIERAHFVGESSGGVFSVYFAVKHPERIASLVLCDTPLKASGSSSPATRDSYSMGEKDSGSAMRRYGVEAWTRNSLRFRLDVEHASPELQNFYITEMGKTPAHVAAALNDLVRDTPSREQTVKQIKAPVLLLGGDHSPISGAEQQAFVREMPNAKLHVFPGYGHGVNVVLPEACAKVALEFWSGL